MRDSTGAVTGGITGGVTDSVGDALAHANSGSAVGGNSVTTVGVSDCSIPMNTFLDTTSKSIQLQAGARFDGAGRSRGASDLALRPLQPQSANAQQAGQPRERRSSVASVTADVPPSPTSSTFKPGPFADIAHNAPTFGRFAPVQSDDGARAATTRPAGAVITPYDRLDDRGDAMHGAVIASGSGRSLSRVQEGSHESLTLGGHESGSRSATGSHALAASDRERSLRSLRSNASQAPQRSLASNASLPYDCSGSAVAGSNASLPQPPQQQQSFGRQTSFGWQTGELDNSNSDNRSLSVQPSRRYMDVAQEPVGPALRDQFSAPRNRAARDPPGGRGVPGAIAEEQSGYAPPERPMSGSGGRSGRSSSGSGSYAPSGAPGAGAARQYHSGYTPPDADIRSVSAAPAQSPHGRHGEGESDVDAYALPREQATDSGSAGNNGSGHGNGSTNGNGRVNGTWAAYAAEQMGKLSLGGGGGGPSDTMEVQPSQTRQVTGALTGGVADSRDMRSDVSIAGSTVAPSVVPSPVLTRHGSGLERANSGDPSGSGRTRVQSTAYEVYNPAAETEVLAAYGMLQPPAAVRTSSLQRRGSGLRPPQEPNSRERVAHIARTNSGSNTPSPDVTVFAKLTPSDEAASQGPSLAEAFKLCAPLGAMLTPDAPANGAAAADDERAATSPEPAAVADATGAQAVGSTRMRSPQLQRTVSAPSSLDVDEGALEVVAYRMAQQQQPLQTNDPRYISQLVRGLWQRGGTR